MRKAFWDEKLGKLVATELHRHIQHGSADAPDEFALHEGRTLEVQAAHHAVARHRFIVLDKADFLPEKGGNFLVKLPLGEAFEEISAGILENFGLNDVNP